MDINADGYLDILSGSYSRMEQDMAGLFQVLYGNEDKSFRPAEVLNGADGEPLIIPAEKENIVEKICTRPFAVDWNGDGNLDLVVGNFGGTFYVFQGQGEGKFDPKPEQIKSGDQPLRITGAHADPFVVDWDGDGDLDILSGSSNGGVAWAENVAEKGRLPEMKPFQQLIEAGQQFAYGASLKEEDIKGPTTSTRIWVDDVNGDGKLDLLVGDAVTLVSAAKGLSDEEMKEKLDAWQVKVQEASKAMSEAGEDEEARTKAGEEFSKLYEERSEFMNEDRTGFVWLYLQK